MTSLNALKELLKQFAESHKQVAEFSWGSELLLSGLQEPRFPLLHITPLSAQANENILDQILLIKALDLSQRDNSESQAEVSSDTQQILVDLYRTFTYLEEINWVSINTSSTITPLWSSQRDDLTGWEMQVTININLPIGACDIPALPPWVCFDPTGPCSGEQGPQGFQGPAGSGGGGTGEGPQGPQGAEGVGFQGFQGPVGFQGLQGWQGLEGFGFQGPIGFQGPAGGGGTGSGSQGPQGPQGWQGVSWETTVVSSNTAATINGYYHVVANSTFTDPVPQEGRGFVTFIRNGTAVIGGISYSTPGQLVYRIFHSGAWQNYVIGNAGFQGPQGWQGLLGSTGTQGPQGLQGLTGTGFQGPQGLQGPTASGGTSFLQLPKRVYNPTIQLITGEYYQNILYFGGNLSNNIIAINSETLQVISTTAFDRVVTMSKITSITTPELWTVSGVSPTTIARHTLSTGSFIAATAITGAVTSALNTRFIPYSSTVVVAHNNTNIYIVNPSTFVTTNSVAHGLGNFTYSAYNSNSSSSQFEVALIAGANGVLLYNCNSQSIVLSATTLSGAIGRVIDVAYSSTLDQWIVLHNLSNFTYITYLNITGAATLSVDSTFQVITLGSPGSVAYAGNIFVDDSQGILALFGYKRCFLYELGTSTMYNSNYYESTGSIAGTGLMDSANSRLFILGTGNASGSNSQSTEILY